MGAPPGRYSAAQRARREACGVGPLGRKACAAPGMAGLESVAALRARAGEGALAYEQRGRQWLTERRARDVVDVQRVILEEQEAERRRLQQLVHLDTIARGKRSGPHAAARKSALRLHERQREASRNKVEALTGEAELTLARATQQFQRTLKALREAGKCARAGPGEGSVARVLASVRVEEDEVKEDAATEDEAKDEGQAERLREMPLEASARDLAAVGQPREPEAKEAAQMVRDLRDDTSERRSAGGNNSGVAADASDCVAHGAAQSSSLPSPHPSPRTLAAASSFRADHPSPRMTEASSTSQASARGSARVETPRSGRAVKAGLGEAESDGARAALPANEAAADAVTGADTRDGAGSARDGAGSARDGASSTRDGAGSARDGAGSARDGAGSARDGAGSARDGASSAREGAGSARDGASSTRDGAGSARDGAGSARDGAGSARHGAGSARSARPGSGSGAARPSLSPGWINSDSFELRLGNLLNLTPARCSPRERDAEVAAEAAQAEEAADGDDGALA